MLGYAPVNPALCDEVGGGCQLAWGVMLETRETLPQKDECQELTPESCPVTPTYACGTHMYTL